MSAFSASKNSRLNPRLRQANLAGTPAFIPGRRTTLASRRARPIVMNQSLHVVLRSDLAKGAMNLRRHEVRIEKLLAQLAKRHGVHVFKMANVGNHIHIHLRVTKRLKWQGFISGLTGGIARAVGFIRGETDRSFWNTRPFSRVVRGPRDFATIQDYVELNQLEANGEVPPRSMMRQGQRWRNVVRFMRTHN